MWLSLFSFADYVMAFKNLVSEGSFTDRTFLRRMQGEVVSVLIQKTQKSSLDDAFF